MMINYTLVQFEVEQAMARSRDIDLGANEHLEDRRREQSDVFAAAPPRGAVRRFCLRLTPGRFFGRRPRCPARQVQLGVRVIAKTGKQQEA
jgi:hypothetical protein